MQTEVKSGYTITQLPPSERPRERLETFGPGVLKDSELLAILLRVGVQGENAVALAERLIDQFGGFHGLQRTPFSVLSRQRGVGTAKAAQILAAVEIGNRISKTAREVKPIISSPEDAAREIRFEMSGLDKEHLWILLLDTRNRLVGIERLYVGSVNSSSVRVGELFRAAIHRNLTSIILAHNHPSGDPSPSPEDIALTRAAVQAGKLLDIEVLDHLVIGGGNFISLKEKCLGF